MRVFPTLRLFQTLNLDNNEFLYGIRWNPEFCMIIVSIFQNADSYRSHPNLESEIATRTISTELNAHADQYELTETITVPPEAAHTEIVESLPSSTSKAGKFLSNFGIKMLEEENAGTNLPCFVNIF